MTVHLVILPALATDTLPVIESLFFFIGLCSLSLQSFLNVIANKALGAGKHAGTVFLALYLPQVILRVYTDYWTKWISYHARLMITAMMAVASLILLYTFMDESSNITDKSLFHFPRICVLFSTILVGLSTTIAEVTAYGYCTYFEKQCTNTLSSGGGFGALLGASISLIQNELHFSNKDIIIGCFLFPIGLAVSYSLGVTHDNAKYSISSIISPKSQTDASISRKGRIKSDSALSITTTVTKAVGEKKTGENTPTVTPTASDLDADEFTLTDVREKRIGAKMTIKLLIVDLIEYTFPLFAVYCLYNIVLAGFIAPSYDVINPITNKTEPYYKKVYQYFVFSLRIGVFLGKSSGFLYIRRFFIFPTLFSVGCFYGGLLAYAPQMMKWFILETNGHLTLWAIGLPLGWTYGATSSNILFGIRSDCTPKLKEFALSNVTFASAFGQTVGNILAIFISSTVIDRDLNL